MSDKLNKDNVRRSRAPRNIILISVIIILSLYVTIAAFAFVLSFSKSGYSLVTRISLRVFSFRIPVYIFAFRKTVSLLLGNFRQIYMFLQMQTLIPFAAGAFSFLFLTSILGRVNRMIVNKTSTLHGSQRWATKKELEKSGLLNKRAMTGVVLGQTFDAEYEYKKKKLLRPPVRRAFPEGDEGKEQYKMAKEAWLAQKKRFNRNEMYPVLKKKGQVITENMDQHVLVVGSTRSGKGVGVVIPTNFCWGESMIIMDPKAEAWAIASHHRSTFSYTFKFDPTNPAESIHYNPLLSIRRGKNAIADLQNLAYILIPDNEGAKDPYWDQEARRLFQAVVGYVIYCLPADQKNFRSVLRVFSPSADEDEQIGSLEDERENMEDGSQQNQDNENKSEVKSHLQKILLDLQKFVKETPLDSETYEKFLKRFNLSREERKKIEKDCENRIFESDITSLRTILADVAYFLAMEERQLSSVVSSMMVRLQVIADPNVQDVTNRSDFMFEDFVEGVDDGHGRRLPMSLYLCAELRDLDRLMPLFRLFYDQAVKTISATLESEKDMPGRIGTKRKYRLLMIMDEFRQLGRMEIIEKALALSAGYNILCLMIVQGYDQLREIYHNEGLITNNCGFQIILRTNEEATAAKTEKILGQATKKHYQISTQGKMFDTTHFSESENVSESGRSLMDAAEILRMSGDESLILASGAQAGKHSLYPYKAKKIRYFLDDRFRDCYLDPKTSKPYALPLLKDNYPHPEALDDDGNFIGLDRQGWMLLKGFTSTIVVDSYGDEAEEEYREDEERSTTEPVVMEDITPGVDKPLDEEFEGEIPLDDRAIELPRSYRKYPLGNESLAHKLGEEAV